MINETRERFLRGILERVSPERIVEIHFFPPIRQGQLESGVAVVALESAPIRVVEAVTEPLVDDTLALEHEADLMGARAAGMAEAPEAPVAEATGEESAIAVAEAPADGTEEEPTVADADERAEEPAPEPEAPVMAVASRLEVCTASYRWTRKGPERGKWEFDFKTEGDASLPIVGTVVRGVEQRSGDELGALRMEAEELRALMDSPAWQRTTP